MDKRYAKVDRNVVKIDPTYAATKRLLDSLMTKDDLHRELALMTRRVITICSCFGVALIGAVLLFAVCF